MLTKYIILVGKKEGFLFSNIFPNWSYLRIRENFLMQQYTHVIPSLLRDRTKVAEMLDV